MEPKQTVLITGATSGIGKELARLFAKEGYKLVIVARDEQKLEDTADELKEIGALQVTPISCDLSVVGSAQKLYNQVRKRRIVIGTLINDAGAGEHGFFKETPLDEELAIIQLNVTSLVQLTKLYMREMVRRDEGKILQLASIASYQPTPLLAVYAATKAFVLSFTDALINELKDSNVTMTALIPGATDTEFYVRANAENIKATENMAGPDVVAKIGFQALMNGKPHAVAPGMKSQILKSSLMSNQQVAAMARKQMEVKTTPS
ncbi:SDR family NAD(P)-dependent oxidoreductase [Fluviicola sp.]|uniref:SDR family NAD(P)-dependent oxidoreductase n=1 Tax=Fluviicola sp. TaxID=1917219 RepID=UPI003D268344